jgi:hypothetical protein
MGMGVERGEYHRDAVHQEGSATYVPRVTGPAGEDAHPEGITIAHAVPLMPVRLSDAGHGSAISVLDMPPHVTAPHSVFPLVGNKEYC